MRHVAYIALSLALLWLVAGCRYIRRQGRGETSGRLAKVGDAVLKSEDLKGIYPAGISAEDSLVLADNYVNSWVRRQVKILEAEKVLEQSGIDVEALIADYRNSLLTHRLEQHYVERLVDTVISDVEVREYYDTHKVEFVLERSVVKGSVVRVPASYRQQARLREVMASDDSQRRQDFLDIVAKNGFTLTQFDAWTDFEEVLALLPTIRGRSYDYLLAPGAVKELSDADWKYYVRITESIAKGGQAPMELSDGSIRRIIFNQRSSEVLRRTEDSLYAAALEEGIVKLNK